MAQNRLSVACASVLILIFVIALCAVPVAGRVRADAAIPCSNEALITAITDANTVGAGTISLPAGCTITLDASIIPPLRVGLPRITGNIQITGNGATIRRDPAAQPFLLFWVNGWGKLTLIDITLQGGQAQGGDGVDGTGGAQCTAVHGGGGPLNAETAPANPVFTLGRFGHGGNGSTLAGERGGFGSGDGGVGYYETYSDGRNQYCYGYGGGGGGGGGFGGALFIEPFGYAYTQRVTFVANTAQGGNGGSGGKPGGGGGSGYGGAVFNAGWFCDAGGQDVFTGNRVVAGRGGNLYRDFGTDGAAVGPDVYHSDAYGQGIVNCNNGLAPTRTPSPTPTSTPAPPAPDRIGVFKDGVFYLAGVIDYSRCCGVPPLKYTFAFGDPGDLPTAGDWNGDGIDTVGVFRPTTGEFFLTNSNIAPVADYAFTFGNPGDTPFAGRWLNSMGHDGVGVYRSSNGILYEKAALSTGYSDFFAVFGNPGDQGVAGDWDGDGLDSIGVYRFNGGDSIIYYTNNSQPAGIVYDDGSRPFFAWTNPIVIGDWDGRGRAEPALLSATGMFYRIGATYPFGPQNALPIAGRWDGNAPARPPQILVSGTGLKPGQNPGPGAAGTPVPGFD